MYTLRMIDESGQHNWKLGNNYVFIGRFENPKDFRRIFKNTFNIDHLADNDPNSTNDMKRIVGFVTSDILEVAVIYKGPKYYVMSPNGQTFANLSY